MRAEAWGALYERSDVLAYLTRRIGNAEAVGAGRWDCAEEARWWKRGLEVVRDEIAQGQHSGAAAVAAKLDQDAAAVATGAIENGAAAVAVTLDAQRVATLELRTR